jgi:hypothetical protein
MRIVPIRLKRQPIKDLRNHFLPREHFVPMFFRDFFRQASRNPLCRKLGHERRHHPRQRLTDRAQRWNGRCWRCDKADP